MDSTQRCRDQASECLQREAATLRVSPLAGQDLLVRSADTPRSYVNRALKFERPPQLAAGPVPNFPKETTPVGDNRGRYLVRAKTGGGIGRPTIKARPNKSLRPSNLGTLASLLLTYLGREDFRGLGPDQRRLAIIYR